MSKEEIISEMKEAMPFNISDSVIPYIEEAMQIYADQEKKSFALWISNLEVNGRTIEELIKDYEKVYE